MVVLAWVYIFAFIFSAGFWAGAWLWWREWKRGREELAEEVVRVAFRVTGAGVRQLATIYGAVLNWRSPRGTTPPSGER